jgi:hypothetical protein
LTIGFGDLEAQIDFVNLIFFIPVQLG